MPKYLISIPLEGEPFPAPIDARPLPLEAAEERYQVRVARFADFPGDFLVIDSIEADDDRAAYAEAYSLLNGCLNVLCALYDYRAVLGRGYASEDLESGRRLAQGLIDARAVDARPTPFPEVLPCNRECRSASFFRQASVASGPLDRCRLFCLAIEEAGKRIKSVHGPHHYAERRVVSDTIERVFRKLSNLDRLRAIRAEIPNAYFSEKFRDGKNALHHALNDFIYQHVRCRVMHAGETSESASEFRKETYAPFDPEDEAQARRILPWVEEIARLYVRFDLGMAEPCR